MLKSDLVQVKVPRSLSFLICKWELCGTQMECIWKAESVAQVMPYLPSSSPPGPTKLCAPGHFSDVECSCCDSRRDREGHPKLHAVCCAMC